MSKYNYLTQAGFDKIKQELDHLKVVGRQDAARFVECNVYDTRSHVQESFDIVFSSFGVTGWLPDLRPWAQVIKESLKPGGRFILVEFHPYVWMSQVGPDLSIRYPYFNRGPITEAGSGTYAERRHLHRESPRLPDTALDLLDPLLEVRVAGIDVAPGVEDRDHRLAGVVRARVAHLRGARTVAERAQVVHAVPAVAAQLEVGEGGRGG